MWTTCPAIDSRSVSASSLNCSFRRVFNAGGQTSGSLPQSLAYHPPRMSHPNFFFSPFFPNVHLSCSFFFSGAGHVFRYGAKGGTFHFSLFFKLTFTLFLVKKLDLNMTDCLHLLTWTLVVVSYPSLLTPCTPFPFTVHLSKPSSCLPKAQHWAVFSLKSREVC